MDSHSCDDIGTHLESTVAGAFYQLLIRESTIMGEPKKTNTSDQWGKIW
jgi:hypothetical protein